MADPAAIDGCTWDQQPARIRMTPRRILAALLRTRTPALFDELAALARDGVTRFRFAGQDVWLVIEPAWCRQLLAAPPDRVARGGVYRKGTAILGHSLVTTEGALHRLRRRQMQPAFQRSAIETYAPSIVAAAQATSAQWEGATSVDMAHEMAALTLDAIGRAVLGMDGRAAAEQIAPALDTLLRGTPLLFLPGFHRLMTTEVPVLRRLQRPVKALQAAAMQAAEASSAELVHSLRDCTDVPALTAEELRDELLTLLFAGHETTATTLTWAWCFLDRHPAVAGRLRSELAAVLGDAPATYADISRLPYTQAVVAETLRLRPAAWILEREITGDVTFGPHHPPVGATLLISAWLLHRSVSSWPAPHDYRPERWLDADGRYDDAAPGQPRGAWLPFGAGSHVCIGASFAWTEAVLALATLARRWAPTLQADEVSIRAAATLRPARAVPMRVSTTGERLSPDRRWVHAGQVPGR